MFTTVDKALAAVLVGLLFLAKTYFGIDLGLNDATVNTAAAFITAVMVYLVPNKPAAPAAA